jgi:hypothetical protein
MDFCLNYSFKPYVYKLSMNRILIRKLEFIVELNGLEPLTFCLQSRRSTN